jgi:hypothetical protein
MAASTILIGANPFSSIRILELPVFQPNEYFFEHHQQPGEKQWETYRRVMREIMAEYGDYKLTDVTIEDKFKFREIIYPPKGKKEEKPQESKLKAKM